MPLHLDVVIIGRIPKGFNNNNKQQKLFKLISRFNMDEGKKLI